MRIIIVAAVVGLAAASVTSWSSRAEAAAADLTEADADRVVSDLLNQQSYETLLLGNLVVYAGTAPIPPGDNITSAQYSRYKIWERIGLIDVVSKPGSTSEPSQPISPWTDWSQGGRILDRITVTPTSKATDYGYYLGTALRIRIASFNVDYLSKNEEHLIGVNTYRILAGVYVSRWLPTFLNFCRTNNACVSAEKGKFIVLVKLNEFTERWNVVAWDVADINHEFATHNVDQQILSLH